MITFEQIPAPSSCHRAFTGDLFTFRVRLSQPQRGSVWLRSNIGRAAVHRSEIIPHVERHEPVLARDWHDLPFTDVD